MIKDYFRDGSVTCNQIGLFHNCAGKVVGRQMGKYLYACSGQYVGCFDEDGQLFDSNGEYIGELIKLERDLYDTQKSIESEKGSYVRLAVKNAKVGKIKDEPFSTLDTSPVELGCNEVSEIAVPKLYEDFIVSKK